MLSIEAGTASTESPPPNPIINMERAFGRNKEGSIPNQRAVRKPSGAGLGRRMVDSGWPFVTSRQPSPSSKSNTVDERPTP